MNADHRQHQRHDALADPAEGVEPMFPNLEAFAAEARANLMRLRAKALTEMSMLASTTSLRTAWSWT